LTARISGWYPGVKVVEQIDKRGKIVVSIQAVHVVVDSDEADAIGWEKLFP
jgi:hypothetical protein